MNDDYENPNVAVEKSEDVENDKQKEGQHVKNSQTEDGE